MRLDHCREKTVTMETAAFVSRTLVLIVKFCYGRGDTFSLRLIKLFYLLLQKYILFTDPLINWSKTEKDRLFN